MDFGKRGVTLPAKILVGLIVGIAVLFILIALISLIYNMVTSSAKKEQAEGQLNLILRALYDAKVKGEANFLLYVPAGSYLVGLEKVKADALTGGYITSECGKEKLKIVPNKMCYDANCICICEKNKDVIDCEQFGVCKDLGYVPKFNNARLCTQIAKENLVETMLVKFDESSQAFLFEVLSPLDYNTLFNSAGLFNFGYVSRTGGGPVFPYRSSEEWEAYLNFRLNRYLELYPSTIGSIYTSDTEKYVFSHILVRASQRYGITHYLILSVMNAESGVLSSGNFDESVSIMGDINGVEADDLCNNRAGLISEIEVLNIDYKEKVKGEEGYLKLLNEIFCGAKKLNDTYSKYKSKELTLSPINIGEMEITPQNAETGAIYYYLYYDPVSDSQKGLLDKINNFWLAYSRMDRIFRLEWSADLIKRQNDKLKETKPIFNQTKK
jgi:hypothetical protein